MNNTNYTDNIITNIDGDTLSSNSELDKENYQNLWRDISNRYFSHFSFYINIYNTFL